MKKWGGDWLVVGKMKFWELTCRKEVHEKSFTLETSRAGEGLGHQTFTLRVGWDIPHYLVACDWQ